MSDNFTKISSGIMFEGLDAEPSSPLVGEVFYDTVAGAYKMYLGAWIVIAGNTNLATLTNKTLTSPVINGGTIDTDVRVIDTSVATKKLAFLLSGATATKTMTVASAHTLDRTLTLPDATDTLVGKATNDVLTNKTLTSPVLNIGVSGSAVLDEDDLASNSSTKLATQRSIKKYVDDEIAGVNPTGTDVIEIGTGDYTVNVYTITDLDNGRAYHAATGTTDRTITLPTLIDNIYRIITIIKTDGGVGIGTLTIDGEGSETVGETSTSFVLHGLGDSITIQASPTGWRIHNTSYGTYADVVGTNYTILPNSTIGSVIVNAGASNRTVSLPLISSMPEQVGSRIITITKTDTGVGTVIVTQAGSDGIDGAATFTLLKQWDSVTVRAIGTGWGVIAKKMLNFSVDTQPPVGSILAYMPGGFSATNNVTWLTGGPVGAAPTPLQINNYLPTNWRVCDGTLCADAASAMFNGRYLPKLTDGRFLMGAQHTVTPTVGLPTVYVQAANNGNQTTLAITNMPNHDHPGGDLNNQYSLGGTKTFATMAHTHNSGTYVTGLGRDSAGIVRPQYTNSPSQNFSTTAFLNGATLTGVSSSVSTQLLIGVHGESSAPFSGDDGTVTLVRGAWIGTTGNTGSGTAFSILPQYLTTYYIIRVK